MQPFLYCKSHIMVYLYVLGNTVIAELFLDQGLNYEVGLTYSGL